jgi:hypothetical protein
MHIDYLGGVNPLPGSMITISPGGVVTASTTGLTIAQWVSPTTVDADGPTVTLDLGVSNWHAVVLGGNRTLAVSRPAVDQQFSVILQQDGTGGRTVTWWSGILWPGGTAPPLSGAAGKRDVFTFRCVSAGTYLSFVAGQGL